MQKPDAPLDMTVEMLPKQSQREGGGVELGSSLASSTRVASAIPARLFRQLRRTVKAWFHLPTQIQHDHAEDDHSERGHFGRLICSLNSTMPIRVMSVVPTADQTA